MAYCINPNCEHRQNPDDAQKCLNCGTELLIDQRFRLIKPLRPLDFRHKTEIFEVEENGNRKVMKVLKSSDSKAIELLERETLTLQLFDHPGIPRVVDDLFSMTPNNSTLKLHCLVMQKIEGQNLEKWIEENGRISQEVAINWLKQLVEIIDEVHRTGYFHRDIKPSNIIVQPNGQLTLIDFGGVREVTNTYLAKVSGVGGNDIGLGGRYEITVLYSAYYAPLEQINGQAVPQSDFYALGRTFAYLVTGIPLGNLPTDQETTRLIWRKKAPQIEKPLADLLDDMMSPAPGKRPAAAKFILQRLENLPFKLTVNRIVHSHPFRVGLLLTVLLGGFGIYKVINLGLSTYYFSQASRYVEQPKIAKKYYELAIKHNPEDVVAYNNLALACQQIRDDDCAIKNYQKTLNLQSNYWIAHYNLGNFYELQKKYELAEEEYKLAIKVSNNEAINAVSNLARLNNIKGEYEEAVELSLQGLKETKNPEWQAGLYKNLGWARFKQKRYREAQEYLQKSVKLDSTRIDAYCLLGQTQEALNEMQEARLSWELCMLGVEGSGLPEVIKWRQQLLDRLLKNN
ncbi:serine/threonine-protein kinase [Nostoc sp. UHCC 0870]|uniref:serine/threonine-protein kinase n=1 Tax=Nostoc sp. UHCC 0870 TaxID=2914041 RepID=UPI001EDF8D39|nr:serine/threonine-protein kinase [Nostoc sp. UHCC 0870]UKP01095.1 serine/threonine-protein kinase [Nostoc sp. UHCC 0870]